MYKIIKETRHGTNTHKCNLGTERSAKMVLDDLKNKHLANGEQVFYDGDSLNVSSGVIYTILKQ